MSTLLQRTLSGAVYAAVIIGSILEPSGYIFPIVVAVMTVLAIREFFNLTGKDTWLLVMTSLMATFVQFFLWNTGRIAKKETYNELFWVTIGVTAIVGFILPFIVTLAELFRKQENPMKNWGRFWQALVMIAFPFACMDMLHAVRPYYLLALFISVWVNDTGAYLVGCSTARLPKGNHKMLPRVSPAKSWEGLAGGILLNLAAGYVFYRVGWMHDLSLALIFTAIVSLFGTLGDLLESLLKRTVGVKDSGRFMPGHGGVLDRFDSLLLATPCILVFLFFYHIF